MAVEGAAVPGTAALGATVALDAGGSGGAGGDVVAVVFVLPWLKMFPEPPLLMAEYSAAPVFWQISFSFS